MSIEANISHLLDTLIDPYLNLSGLQMNLKYTIESTHNTLSVTIVSAFPCQMLRKHYQVLAQECLQQHYPKHQISLTHEHFIRPHKTQMPGKGLRGVKNTIAIASGKGGVGKSTVTVHLACALAQCGARVGILDADIYGPSIPLMLGASNPVAISGDHYLPVAAHGMQAMSIGYLSNNEQALIWRGPMLAKSLIQMLDLTLWDDLDYLFIDLPPGTGDIQLSLVQKIPLTAALIVTTPQNVATLDAQKAISLFEKTHIDVLGIVENMSTHICSHCAHEEHIFGHGGAQQLCQKHKIPLLGQLPLNSAITQQCDSGNPVTNNIDSSLAEPFIKTALRTAIELSKKPINYADKFPDIVVA